MYISRSVERFEALSLVSLTRVRQSDKKHNSTLVRILLRETVPVLIFTIIIVEISVFVLFFSSFFFFIFFFSYLFCFFFSFFSSFFFLFFSFFFWGVVCRWMWVLGYKWSKSVHTGLIPMARSHWRHWLYPRGRRSEGRHAASCPHHDSSLWVFLILTIKWAPSS